ncbi:MAG: glycosyltransferase [Terracidiphilus sp.]|jgi:glycosyltransferase involved in cell wall biosynthesis
MQPVTIIATVLNEVQDIARLVPSLLAQTPPAAEVVIVDGGSTDGTWEWLEGTARASSSLRAIRDESCNLRRCPGPIARGRNVAIAAATSDLIACADAGCTYAPDWLSRISGPLVNGSAEYALGGSAMDLADPTVWDLASAHFFGVRLGIDKPTKSCTARSMAFRKELWKRIGGFPETAFFGEDTLFDQRARDLTQPAFVERAKALYRPQYTLRTACRQLAGYAASDGILGVRPARLFRNGARCVLELAALCALRWTIYPLVVVVALECWFAFRHDLSFLLRKGLRTVGARLLFSILVPWIVAGNQIRGRLTGTMKANRQNLQR